MDLNKFQSDLNSWLDHNFPNTNSDAQIKGVMEELGELCHYDLKWKQQIRGITKENAIPKIKDAVGDIVIYLCNYCNTMNISFRECVQTAMTEIMKRDWIEDPEGSEIKLRKRYHTESEVE